MADCGSYGGYQRHRKANEDACDACKEANTAYQARYRKRRPDVLADVKRNQLARGRALRRLARRHPAELRSLYAEERRKAARKESA